MSLITSCSSCGTKFRVVSDQLRISEGWVRCGRCQTVFDAQLTLRQGGPLSIYPPAESAESADADFWHDLGIDDVSTKHSAHAVGPASVLDWGDGLSDVLADSVEKKAEAVENEWAALGESVSRLVEDGRRSLALQNEAFKSVPSDLDGKSADEKMWAELLHDPEIGAESAFQTRTQNSINSSTQANSGAKSKHQENIDSRAESWLTSTQAHDDSWLENEAAPVAGSARDRLKSRPDYNLQSKDSLASEAMPELPSFVKQAYSKAVWSNPVVRFMMVLLILFCSLALLTQITLHQRNWLLAWKPEWRPGFAAVCQFFNCKLAPYQNIQSVVLTGSSFTQGAQPDHYILDLSIKNQDKIPVATPAVELTLTDTQDKVLVRKVLSPAEIGAPAELAPGSEWSGALPVATIDLNIPVAGYRVTAFYP